MNSVSTGDAGVDAFLAWINEGGKLTSVSAVTALAVLIRFAAIPAINYLATRYGNALTGVRKIMAIHATGVVLAVAIDFATHSAVTMTQAAMLGFIASNTAIGFHQTSQQAQKDQNQKDQIVTEVLPLVSAAASGDDSAFLSAVTEAASA